MVDKFLSKNFLICQKVKQFDEKKNEVKFAKRFFIVHGVFFISICAVFLMEDSLLVKSVSVDFNLLYCHIYAKYILSLIFFCLSFFKIQLYKIWPISVVC